MVLWQLSVDFRRSDLNQFSVPATRNNLPDVRAQPYRAGERPFVAQKRAPESAWLGQPGRITRTKTALPITLSHFRVEAGDSTGSWALVSWGNGSQINWDPFEPIVVVQVKKLLADVRCYGNGNYASITSLSDGAAKSGAASSMFAAARGAGLAPGVGQTFTATWADGGTSTYVVTGGMGSIGISYEPISQTMVDGVPKSSACTVG